MIHRRKQGQTYCHHQLPMASTTTMPYHPTGRYLFPINCNIHPAISPNREVPVPHQLQHPSCHITQQGYLVLISLLSSHSKGWTGVMSSSTAQLHQVPPANVQGVGSVSSYHGVIGTALGRPLFAFLHLHLVFGQLVRTTPVCISPFTFGIRAVGMHRSRK